jgi:hypothetical protein
MQLVEKASNAKQNASVEEMGLIEGKTKYKHLITNGDFEGRWIKKLILQQ